MRSYRTTLLLALALSTLVAACAAKHPAGSPRMDRCDRADQDSSAQPHTPLYLMCAVDTPARPSRNELFQPNFQPSPGGKSCYSAMFEFAVNASGIPEMGSSRVVRTNDIQYANAMLQAIPAMIFHPALLGGVPVRQIVPFGMVMIFERSTQPRSAMELRVGGRTTC